MQQIRKRCRPVGLSIWFFPLFFLAPSHSMSTQSGQTQILQEQLRQQDRILQPQQQQEQAIEQQRQLKEQEPGGIDIQPAPEEASALSDQPCFEMQRIQLNGAQALSAKTEARLKAPYLNRCIGMISIQELIRDITNYYIDKGFVTSRAYVPEQDIRNGELVIEVLEGRIERIQINENRRRDQASGLTAFPFMQGQRLNLRDIEQGLDQINRLPSNQATVKLMPGKNPGDSLVQINNPAGKRYRVSGGFDNAGQRSIGTVQRSLALELDNPLGLNEQWIINYLEDNLSGSERSHRSLSAYFSAPFGYWTLSYNGSYFEYTSSINTLNDRFETSGDSLTHSLGLSQVVYRDAETKGSVNTRLIVKETNNFLQGNRIEVGSRRLSILHIGANYSRRFLGGVVSLGLAWERGIRAFNALRDPSSLRPGQASAQFEKITTSLNFSRPFRVNDLGLNYNLAFNGQWTDDDLFSSEQISLGGQYSIRGFKENIALGDTGAYARNEVSIRLPRTTTPLWSALLGEPEGFIAYDIGMLKRDRTDPLERGRLSGIALGLRKQAGALRWQATIAKSLSAPDYIKEVPYEIYLKMSLHY